MREQERTEMGTKGTADGMRAGGRNVVDAGM